jgi:hypothetical protein
VRPDPDAPGHADLTVGLAVEDAHACWAAADAIARAARAAGDDRPLGVLRAQAVRDRLLGPDTDPDRPPIAAQVTVLAPLDALEHAASRADELGDTGGATFAAFRPAGRPAPTVDPTGRRTPIGEVHGRPITATHLRELLERLDALCPGGLQAPTGGGLAIAVTDPDGALRAVLTPADLRSLARRGCPDHPPGADCGCGLLDRPADVEGYRPSAAQYAFIRTRDRRCRMPGCTSRAAWADLDHVIPHACGGATSCDNLCCLCRRHHRLKTHAPGWATRLTPDGTYTVTSPSGITRTTQPPGLLVAGTPAGREPPGRARPEEDPPPF